jgi:hypothetical protein
VLAIANTQDTNARWFCPDLKIATRVFSPGKVCLDTKYIALNKIAGPKLRWHSSCYVGSAGSSSATLAQSSDM